MEKQRAHAHLTSAQVIIIGFVSVILLGALLLSLPCATREPGHAGWLDALFTSTSAVCVTGLVVVDTATHWSLMGHCVLLIAIQIGGLGLMTVAALVMMMLRRRIGLAERSILYESVSSLSIGGIVRLTKRICIGTAVIESVGALVLFTRFLPVFGWKRGLFYSVFHSVSAFCNAGFDLMGTYSGE